MAQKKRARELCRTKGGRKNKQLNPFFPLYDIKRFVSNLTFAKYVSFRYLFKLIDRVDVVFIGSPIFVAIKLSSPNGTSDKD